MISALVEEQREVKKIAKRNTTRDRLRKKWGGKDILLLVLTVVTVAAVCVAIWAISTRDVKAPDPSPQDETAKPVKKLTDTIDIPQFGWLNLKANTVEQTLTFENPPQNFAQFRISILLEDGTVLWTSELIQPGETSAPVTLSQPLPAGKYENATLKHECFRMDEALTPLNGAEARLTLISEKEKKP